MIETIVIVVSIEDDIYKISYKLMTSMMMIDKFGY